MLLLEINFILSYLDCFVILQIIYMYSRETNKAGGTAQCIRVTSYCGAAVNISWALPDRVDNMVLRLDGMGFLVSLIGCVGSLIPESYLVDIMSCALRGVDHNVDMKKINVH